MTRLLADEGQIGTYFNAGYRYASNGQIISLRTFRDDGSDGPAIKIHPVKVNGSGLDEVIEAAIAEAQGAADLGIKAVFCPPIAGFSSEAKADEASLSEGYTLSVECDQRPAAARQKLELLLGPATMVVASGGQWTDPDSGEVQDKLHLHWRLNEPATGSDLAKLKLARRLAAELVGADTSNVSVVHPIRSAGSWHRKAEPRLATIVSLTENEIDLADALGKLEAVSPGASEERPDRTARPNGKSALGFDFQIARDSRDVPAAADAIANDDLDWDTWNRFGMMIWAATGGSEEGFAVFDRWSRRSGKYDPKTTAERWRHYFSSPPTQLGAGTLFFEAQKAVPGWRRPSEVEAEAKAEAERPVVRIAAGQLPRMTDEAEAALIAAGTPIFARGDTLVRPVTEEAPAARGRMTMVAKLRAFCPDSLTDALSKAAEFQKFDGRSKAFVTVDPPKQVGGILLARQGFWRVPRVAGVITTPTLRPDGSVLSAPGYDAATRLYLAADPDLRLPPVADCPSRGDAKAALALLLDLLAEFPFVGPVDRAVALSGFITAVVRGGLPVAPMHVVRAHTPGTGKSHLVDVASTIATGRPCPVMAPGKTPEETEKRLGSLLRDGVSIVSIDNVEGELGGDMLCQVTERPFVRVRILGVSEAPEFECKATIFATGNNLKIRGDMTRRAVLCSLDANEEKPELRRFNFDPIARVLENRGAYVAAVLTLARAYRVAGEPEVCPPIGSYSDWSRAVRAPLIWLGEADPVASMETARAEDPELSAHRELFAHWRDAPLIPGARYTTRDLIRVACEMKGSEFVRPDFRDLLIGKAGQGGEISPKRLGMWLRSIEGRQVGGFRLDVSDGSGHVRQFALRPVGPKA